MTDASDTECLLHIWNTAPKWCTIILEKQNGKLAPVIKIEEKRKPRDELINKVS